MNYLRCFIVVSGLPTISSQCKEAYEMIYYYILLWLSEILPTLGN